jgi:hypothetical protein
MRHVRPRDERALAIRGADYSLGECRAGDGVLAGSDGLA